MGVETCWNKVILWRSDAKNGGLKRVLRRSVAGESLESCSKEKIWMISSELNRLEWFRLNLRNFVFRKLRSWKNTLQRNWKEMHDFEWFWDFSCSLIVSVSTILMIFEFPMRSGKVSVRFLWGSTQDWICQLRKAYKGLQGDHAQDAKRPFFVPAIGNGVACE